MEEVKWVKIRRILKFKSANIEYPFVVPFLSMRNRFSLFSCDGGIFVTESIESYYSHLTS